MKSPVSSSLFPKFIQIAEPKRSAASPRAGFLLVAFGALFLFGGERGSGR